MHSMIRRAGLMVAILGAMTRLAVAQEATETVVVTGSRAADYGAPHIAMTKRADHVITTVTVTCDTRDLSQRREELKATLRNMIGSAAGTKTISLGLGQGIIGDLSEGNFDQIIVPDNRADTSKAYVVIKTRVSASNTLNDATGRIKAFIRETPKVGRTEILANDEWDLTIVGPEQYRDQLIGAIVADAKHTAELFGAGYTVAIDGLEHRVSWYQRGPLDLALFIPYELKITPAH